MPPAARSQRFILVETGSISDSEFPADLALLLPNFTLLVIDRFPVDVGNAGTHRRHDFGRFTHPLIDHVRQLIDLTFLNVDEDQAWQLLVPGKVEFADEISLKDLHGHHDKYAEADR